MKTTLILFLGLFLNFSLTLAVAQDIPQIELDAETERLWEAAKSKVRHVNTKQLQQQLKDKPETVLIDVRTPEEIKQWGTIGLYQNQRIPRGWLEFRIKETVPDKKTPIVVYCGTNIRSPLAALQLLEMGYQNVKNYSDGFFRWKQADLETYISDKAPDSVLYAKPKKVIEGVYSAIGAPQPSTYENAGHNNNLSFVIADDAVVVFNAGGSYLLAEAMHEEIKKITALPVKYVVLENAQGHAILGSSYWKAQGAKIIAHAHTAEIIEHELKTEVRTEDDLGILGRAQRNLRDKAHKTQIIMPDRTYSDQLELAVKGRKIEILHLGKAHSPDDTQLWLPEERLLISGDFAFNERMLPILHHTNIRTWLENWPKLEALKPKVIIPGHGDVTDVATVRHFTKGYLEYMLKHITNLIDDGGTLMDAYHIDQSPFMQWKTFRELSRQNADRLYRMLEFE